MTAPVVATPSGGLVLGCDYNPEQWPREQVARDLELMQEAGVNLVTVGVFAWALLEPRPDQLELDWLAGLLDEIHTAGIGVDLATATASPPPWFSRLHPGSMLVDRDGTRLWPGGRQNWCPSSPAYRERSVRLVEELARRFGEHPAVVLWHVSNELGCHNAVCYCEVSAAAFRAWLRARHGDLDGLNEAWSTTFWSQRYSDWEEVLPPRTVPAFGNPAQELDFRRFSSDQLLDQYRAEHAAIRRHPGAVPVTTNLMVMSGFDGADYATWAPHLDVVSNDHYAMGDDPDRRHELSWCGDATRGLADGDPWLLMETSTSAVNWQPRNRARPPGELRRTAFQHLARGADGVCFFQWRASAGGAEKFHSALVPHAGTDTKVWREVLALGSDLRAASELAGSRVVARAALLHDYPSRWALTHPCQPSVDISPVRASRALHRALEAAGVVADVVPATRELDGYRLVVVPHVYLMDDDTAARLGRFVEDGGHVLVTFFSGIVDEHDRVRLGGYPGALREVLGLVVEEFFPLQQGESVDLDDGTRGTVWSELVTPRTARVVARFATGAVAGGAALTRHEHGRGVAWYLATQLDDEATSALVERVIEDAGLPRLPRADGVEVVVRSGHDVEFTILVNHGDETATIPVPGTDLLTGETASAAFDLAAGGVRVVRSSTSGSP